MVGRNARSVTPFAPTPPGVAGLLKHAPPTTVGYYDAVGMAALELFPRGVPAIGERRLMAEVVLSALTDLGVIAARGVRAEHWVRSAEQWLHSSDITWPFAFLNCCDVLGLSAERIRALARELRALPRPHRCTPGTRGVVVQARVRVPRSTAWSKYSTTRSA